MINFLRQIHNNLQEYFDKEALCIENESCSYAFLSNRIAAIQQVLNETDECFIGLITHNAFDTFASVLAIWFSGKTLVPLGSNAPVSRNKNSIEQLNLKIILGSTSDIEEYPCLVNTDDLKSDDLIPQFKEVNSDQVLYILFTSGSTGSPKGVQVTHGNVNSYTTNLLDMYSDLTHDDRFLLTQELTFDGSFTNVLLSLLKGGALYTVPSKGIRYLSIIKILLSNKITVFKAAPSVLDYIHPYLNQISLPNIKYSFFGGEGLPVNRAMEWKKCTPNGVIHNLYGPTEVTISCFHFDLSAYTNAKQYKGILSIGRPFANVNVLVCNDTLDEVKTGVKGELCLSGAQLCKGYWNNEQANSNAFFYSGEGKEKTRYYKTGDIVIKDKDGDLLFVGRKDSQVQINGYRVEIGEIEYQARYFTKTKSAVIYQSNSNAKILVLFIQSGNFNQDQLVAHLTRSLPLYMQPHRIILLDNFPLLNSGKTNYQKLREMPLAEW